MNKFFYKVGYFIAVLTAAFVWSESLRAADAREVGASAEETATQRLLIRVDQAATQSANPAASYDSHLLYLATLSGDLRGQYAFYQQCLERLKAIGSEDTLPIIEALLNRDIYGPRADTTEAVLIRGLREQASQVWYHIRWRDADEATKIDTALYGLRPDSPVRLHDEVSAARLRDLGEVARPALYDLLRDPNLSYGPIKGDEYIYSGHIPRCGFGMLRGGWRWAVRHGGDCLADGGVNGSWRVKQARTVALGSAGNPWRWGWGQVSAGHWFAARRWSGCAHKRDVCD